MVINTIRHWLLLHSNNIFMKPLLFAALLIFSISSQAQYYYKDIVGTSETADMIKNYKANKVSRVVLTSYDADNTKSDDFFVEQVYNPGESILHTHTRSDATGASVLTSFTDADGRVIKTVDSSAASVSSSIYEYDAEGRLIAVTSNSTDTSGLLQLTEQHIWKYNNGSIAEMLRIKNKKDTTVVHFKLDNNGNVIEEQSILRGVASEPVYYYYDDQNRLTDIVRYNTKAKRLLPEYMFEYSPANRVIQKITIPSNGSNYLIWRYQYNGQGLKTKEAVYDKNKQLTGKIEYQYQFGS